MATECANPLYLQWIKEWLDLAKERNSKGVTMSVIIILHVALLYSSWISNLYPTPQVQEGVRLDESMSLSLQPSLRSSTALRAGTEAM